MNRVDVIVDGVTKWATIPQVYFAHHYWFKKEYHQIGTSKRLTTLSTKFTTECSLPTQQSTVIVALVRSSSSSLSEELRNSSSAVARRARFRKVAMSMDCASAISAITSRLDSRSWPQCLMELYPGAPSMFLVRVVAMKIRTGRVRSVNGRRPVRTSALD